MDTPGWWDRFHNNFYRNQEWYLESDELLPIVWKIMEDLLWFLPSSPVDDDDGNPTSSSSSLASHVVHTNNIADASAASLSPFRILHIGCGTSSLGQGLRTLWSNWYRERYHHYHKSNQRTSALATMDENWTNPKNGGNNTDDNNSTLIIPNIEIINIDFSSTCIQYQKEIDPEGIYYTLDATQLPFTTTTTTTDATITITTSASNDSNEDYGRMMNHFRHPFHMVLDKGTIDAVLATRNETTLRIMYNIMEQNLRAIFPTYSSSNSNNRTIYRPLVMIISMIGTLQRYLDIEEGIYRYEQHYLTPNSSSMDSSTWGTDPFVDKDTHTTTEIISKNKLVDYCLQRTTKRLRYYSLERQETGVPPLENPDQDSSYVYLIRPIPRLEPQEGKEKGKDRFDNK